jgi:hypothetical protein
VPRTQLPPSDSSLSMKKHLPDFEKGIFLPGLGYSLYEETMRNYILKQWETTLYSAFLF